MSLDPQKSYLIAASAGCGKTYQLTQRFLNLVRHGARPERILTVTFTRKAAAEMQQRILSAAKQMLADPSSSWVGELVLSQSPRLKIATIDSLFHEWCMRFSYEAGLEGFKLMDIEDEAKVEKDSTEKFLEYLHLHGHQPVFSAYGYYDLSRRWMELRRLQDFITLKDPWSEHPLFHAKNAGTSIDPQDLEHLETEFFNTHASSLLDVAQTLKSAVKDDILKAITSRSIHTLVQSKWITQSLSISKTYHRKELPLALLQLEEDLRVLVNAQRLLQLNQEGRLFYQYFSQYQSIRQKVKNDKLEFSDLTRGVWQIFNNPENVGAQFLIQQGIEHLLIDEFQDTSPLQWSVFARLLSEITAGEGIYQGTGFLVGDVKQSIYGFREADPRIMAEALQMPQMHKSELSLSYRSPRLLCNYVNQVFENWIPDWPHHDSAKSDYHTNELVMVTECFESVQDEARALAQVIASLPKMPTALLLRRRTHASVYQKALMEHGVQVVGASDFFDEPIISDVLSALHVLCYPNDRLSLASVLKSPFLKWSDQDIRHALTHNTHLAELVDKVLKELWGDFAPNTTKAATLVRVLLERFQMRDPRVYKLWQLCEHHSLHSFLERMKLVRQKESIQVDQKADVQIMTIHKSKGLEFDRVIVADTASSWNKTDPYWLRSDRLYYIGKKSEQPVGDPHFDSLLSQVQQQLHEESIRLLYVALTRAKKQLIISGYGKNSAASHTQGRFLEHLQSVPMLQSTAFCGHRVYCNGEQPSSLFVDPNPASTHTQSLQSPQGALPDVHDHRPTFLNPHSVAPSLLTRVSPSLKNVDPAEIRHGGGDDQREEGIRLHRLMERYIKSNLDPHLLAQSSELLRITQSVAWLSLIDGHTRLRSEWSFAKFIPRPSHSPSLRSSRSPSNATAGTWIKGCIDLVVFKGDRDITVVDFKSGSQNPLIYQRQMTYYQQALTDLYPQAAIQAVIFQINSLEVIELGFNKGPSSHLPT